MPGRRGDRAPQADRVISGNALLRAHGTVRKALSDSQRLTVHETPCEAGVASRVTGCRSTRTTGLTRHHGRYSRPEPFVGRHRRLVRIAHAPVIRPAMVLADEPPGNLGGAGGRAFIDRIQDINDGAVGQDIDPVDTRPGASLQVVR